MATSGGDGSAQFDLIIGAPGAKQSLDETTKGLRATGAAAVDAAQAVDRNTAATQRLIDVQQRMAQQEAQARQSVEQLTVAQKALIDAGVTLEQVMAAANGNFKAATTAATEHAQSVETLTNRYNDSRAIVLQHMQALEMEAAAHEQAGAAAGVHGLQLGRLNMELGTASGRILGINTAMTRFAAMLGGSLTGYAEMIAMTAAIVAIGAAYEHFTEQARKAREEQEKLTDALKKWHEEQEAGGQRAQQVAAQQKVLADDMAKLADLQAKLASPNVNRSESVEASLERQIDAVKAKIAEDQHLIQYGSADALKEQQKAFDEQQQQRGRELASLVKFQKDNADVRAQALRQLQIDEALEQQYLKAGDLVRAAEYAEMAKQIQEALKPDKFHVEASGVPGGQNPVLKALTDQLDAMRRVNEESNKEAQATSARIALRNADAEARERLAVLEKAEADRLQAYATLSGVALSDRLKAIDAQQHENMVAVVSAQAHQHAADAVKTMNENMRDVSAIGAHNDAITAATADAEKFAAANAHLADTLQKDLIRALATFGQRGGDWQALARGAEQITARFSDAFASAIEHQTQLYAEANKKQEVDLANSISARIEQLEKFAKAAQVLNAAVEGAQVGYQLGEQSPSAKSGAVNGALGGAAVGFMTAGPWGALAGGLAGLTTGLLGGADAAKKRREAEEALQHSLEMSIEQVRVQAGTADELSLKLMENADAFKKLRDETDAALPGLKNQAERESTLAELNQLEAIRVQQLKDEAVAQRASADFDAFRALQDTRLQLLQAQGSTAAARAYEEQLQLQDLINEWQKRIAAATTDAERDLLQTYELEAVNNLKALQAAEDAKAAADEAQQALDQQRQSLHDALDAQTKAVTDALHAQAELAQKNQQAAQAAVSASQQALDNLTRFKDALVTGDLAAGSPRDQLEAARAQMDQLFASAQHGDKDAAQQFSSTAQTFLQLSRGYNASGAGYASDFASVQQMTNSLITQYGVQRSIDQQMLDSSAQQVDLLTQQLDAVQSASDAISKAIDTASAEQIAVIQQSITNLGSVVVGAVGGLGQVLAGGASNGSGAPTRDAHGLLTFDGYLAAAQSDGVSRPWLNTPENRHQFDLAMAMQSAVMDAHGDITDPAVLAAKKAIDDYNAQLNQQAKLRALRAEKTSGDYTYGPDELAAYGSWMANGSPGTFEDFYNNQYRHDPDLTTPGFASGGDFSGGLRLVGERGPELEVTGPSRIVSNANLGAMMAANISAGRDSLAELKQQNAHLAAAVRVLQAGFQQQNAKLDTLVGHAEKESTQAQLAAHVASARKQQGAA